MTPLNNNAILKTDNIVGFFKEDFILKEEKQKVGQMRKREIREAAKKCFLNKGFQNTTMEDVITEIGMSRGGVYHHYASTTEMLKDLMLDGN